jgi:hypothetical protein
MPIKGPNGQEWEDHDACVKTLTEDGDMSEDEADATCAKWKRQTEQSMNVEITDYPENFFEELDYGIVELAEWSEGDVVNIEDYSQPGVITSLMTENFDFPTSDGLQEVEASEDEPAYVVATPDGPRAVTEDSITGEGDFPDGPGGKEAAKELANGGEEASVYDKMDDPYSMEELINIPGVDDPGVGWDSYPDSWVESEKPARLILLDAWSSLGGTFTTCRADMAGEISRPSRFCASFKDEVLQTERWRNRF